MEVTLDYNWFSPQSVFWNSSRGNYITPPVHVMFTYLKKILKKNIIELHVITHLVVVTNWLYSCKRLLWARYALKKKRLI